RNPCCVPLRDNPRTDLSPRPRNPLSGRSRNKSPSLRRKLTNFGELFASCKRITNSSRTSWSKLRRSRMHGNKNNGVTRTKLGERVRKGSKGFHGLSVLSPPRFRPAHEGFGHRRLGNFPCLSRPVCHRGR